MNPYTREEIVCFYESDLTVFWIIAGLMLVAVVTYLIDCALGWKIKRAIQQNEAYTIRLFNERIETLTKQVESAQMVRDLRHEDQLKTILKALAHLQNDKGNENESTN